MCLECYYMWTCDAWVWNRCTTVVQTNGIRHVQPDEVTFAGVLSACCHICSVDEGCRQFDRM